MSRYLDFIRDFRLGGNDFPTLPSTDIIKLLKEHEPETFRTHWQVFRRNRSKNESEGRGSAGWCLVYR